VAAAKKPRKFIRGTPQMARSRPKVGLCAQCKAKLLTGLYDAVPRYWDHAPLSLLGELAAHLRGVETWWMSELTTYRRSAHWIKSSPEGIGGTIHQIHYCEVPPPVGAAVQSVPKPLPDLPPF